MKFGLKGFLSLGLVSRALCQDYWYETIEHQGIAPYNADPSTYPVFRNVKTYGAKGDGVTDDTAAINAAITDGARCVAGAPGIGCESSTNSPAVVYFPAGTYLISSSIVPYYMTQIIGNPNDLPTLKASAAFAPGGARIGLIDADPYDSANPDYGTTNVFYRQVRNIIFDTTAIPASTGATGIHWPTSQATSLQNCVFKLNSDSGTQHVGIFIENGSGGFLTDLTISGGIIGMNIGSQQFTMRNVSISDSTTAISQLWDWSWLYMGITIDNCGIGIDMSAGGSTAQGVGGIVIIDSTFSNTPVGIKTAYSSTSVPVSGGSLAIENVVFNNVPAAVQGPSTVSLAGSTGSVTVDAYVEGNVYTTSSHTQSQGSVTGFARPSSLLSGSNYYVMSKPQFGSYSASQISSVRTAGAKGDGVTDDSAAIQSIIDSATAAGNIVYFDAGIYKVTTTITIPPGAKIVGETYPTIMGSGSFFSDQSNPQPVVQVGATSGTTGVVDWTDMIVSTQGATEGAILILWNLASPATTPSGLWDVHTRIGGFDGSDLQVANCPVTATQPNLACVAAFQSMKVAAGASGLYLENNWFWTADHDIDDASDTQLSIYSGRGLSIESTAGNVWLIGTAVEHHNLYNFQFVNTKNIFGGYIQTETPYYQPDPVAPGPFTPVASLNDPDFATYCAGKTGNCADAWGLRVLSSTDIMIYGAGFYSFFENYDTTCSDHTTTEYNEYCQTQIFGIDNGGATDSYSGSSVYLYGLATVGVVSMIDVGDSSIASQSDNTGSYAEAIIKFTT